MSNLNNLIEQMVTCLRKSGILDSPVLVSEEIVPVIFPQAEWEEYDHVYPYWQPKKIEIARSNKKVEQSDFDVLESQLGQTSRINLLNWALENIPDSPDTVIVEPGCGYGEKGAGFLAKYKPRSKVILFDKFEITDPDQEFNGFLFVTPDSRFLKLVFPDRCRPIAKEPDVEKRVNSLYRETDIGNVIFRRHNLTLEEVEGNLPSFLQELKGKNIYLMGEKTPTSLPFLMAKLYNRLDARYVHVSPTAQEKVSPESFTWNIIQKRLGLTDSELAGFIDAAYDPNAKKIGLSKKYDYSDQVQKRIGKSIKLAIALALAKEIDGEVLKHIGPEYRGEYNQIDYYVQARR